MARPIEYNRTEVLDKAMEAFWLSGYEATSMDHLVHSTGLSRSSIYQAFGSKRGLFDDAMTFYIDERIAGMLGGMEAEDASLSDVVAFFELIADTIRTYPDRAELGCFMTNSIAELGSIDPELRPAADAYIARLNVAIASALSNAERDGLIEQGTAVDRARVLTGTTLGLFVTMRGNPNPEVPIELALAAARQIRSWELKG